MEKPKEVFVKTDNISEKLKSEKIREKIEVHREKRRYDEKLKQVKSLIDSDDDDDDAAEWYQRTAKRSRKNDEDLSNLKKKSSTSDKKSDSKSSKHSNSKQSYTSNHLKGLAIGHKADSIKEGQQIVLTLRDKDVLAEDEDVLENVNIIDEEKAAKNIENKNKRIDYKPYDDEEFDEFGIIKKSSLLNKYDEEIEGPKVNMFRIGTSLSQNKSFFKPESESSSNKISLNWNDLKIANEYYTEQEMVKFKKPSKKKSQLRKRNQIKQAKNDESFDINSMIIDEKPEKPSLKKTNDSSKKKIQLDIDKIDDNLIGPDEDLSGFVIDDEAENELQSVLHKARKLKMKEKSFIDPALNIAKIVGETKPEKMEDQDDESIIELNKKQIILNQTAEFCRNLGESTSTSNINLNKNHRNVINDEIKFEDNIVKNENINGEDQDDDDDDSDDDGARYRNNWNEVDIKMEEHDDEDDDNASNDEQQPIQSQPILEEEPDVSIGVAGALKLAMTKGYLDKDTGKSFGATKSSIITAQSYTIEEKFHEEDRMGRRDRYSGSIQEFREKDGYRPDFKLDYVDEKGRMMNQKEAFRYLSHKFHGKGPGKNKIDKRMKKMEQESKLRQMSSIDTPLNTVKLLQDKQKELQTPYIVLSGQRTNQSNQLTKISKK